MIDPHQDITGYACTVHPPAQLAPLWGGSGLVSLVPVQGAGTDAAWPSAEPFFSGMISIRGKDEASSPRFYFSEYPGRPSHASPTRGLVARPGPDEFSAFTMPPPSRLVTPSVSCHTEAAQPSI